MTILRPDKVLTISSNQNSNLRATLASLVQMRELKMTKISQFVRDESGATAIEYGLIAALIAVVIIGAVQLVGSNLSTTFNTVAGNVK
jgi:pilus assembly protein Flp/PilA